MDLNAVWFLLIAVLLAGYAALDGFDLGAGMLHLFARTEEERRVNLNAIGPVWDGNEVWLLTGGGALFAAFPPVYAYVFSSFYLALMLLLVALIFRAVSFEFRKQVDSPAWRKLWDGAFGLGSFLAALLVGIAFGNILHGVPLTADGRFDGNFFTLLHPYAILVGLVGLAAFLQHGAIFVALKSQGALQARMAKVAPAAWMALVLLVMAVLSVTFFSAKFLYEGILKKPFFWITFIGFWVSILGVPLAVKVGKFGRAWTASFASIVCLMGLGFTALFPRLVPSSLDLAHSLTAYNAASTPKTLLVMFSIAAVGVPIVIGYTIFAYRVFRGKVSLDNESY
ncbi:MAG: cytochrome d ubiquinol oxidase subunit II [Candidatus Firestonebacteria bacterium]|nr:cytochrome d ubiquinol oxidase subunit II [Candidatus Firestonebacteria bacterium]